jgi:16S rRNA (adenine1518-N6/adenine1519-N6)-dimethyltransferase
MKSAKLGQNFLVNRSIAQKIVDAAIPFIGHPIEIGPGKGILTELLLPKRSPADPKFTVIEIDPKLADKLQERFPNEISIIREDILKLDIEKAFPQQRLTLVGNLPYYISKEIADWLITNHSRVHKGVFMLQKEFVDKLIRTKKSPQSLMFSYLFDARVLFNVSPGSFNPAPKVFSSVFHFTHRPNIPEPTIDPQNLYRLLKISYQNRRKTLQNNLSPHYPKPLLTTTLSNLHIPPTTRAEQLPLQKFLELFRELQK